MTNVMKARPKLYVMDNSRMHLPHTVYSEKEFTCVIVRR